MKKLLIGGAVLALLLIAIDVMPYFNTPSPDVFTGYVEAELVYVAAPQAGWLEKAAAREGDRVSKGQILFELEKEEQQAGVAEARERLHQARATAKNASTGARKEEIEALAAQLKEAEAGLHLARTEHERLLELTGSGVASKSQLDKAEADFDAARAKVETIKANIAVARLAGREAAREALQAAFKMAEAQYKKARWQLGQRTITARTQGRVEEVFHRAGEFVTLGAPLLSVLPDNGMKVRFFIPESRLSELKTGDNVTVQVDNMTALISAKISYIAREAEYTPPVIYSVNSREKLVFMVEARLQDAAHLRPGQPVDVRLP